MEMRWRTFVTVVASLAWCSTSWAEETACAGTVSRGDVVSCALRASLALKSEGDVARALDGRRTAVTPIVPSNPTFSASIGYRSVPTQNAANWSIALSQEIEIGGQRGLRLDEAGAQIASQQHRILAVRRDVAAQAYGAYFDLLAARDELALAARVEAVALSIVTVTRAMSDRGLASGVEADLAEALSIRSVQARIGAEARREQAQVSFTLALGADPAHPLDAAGDLVPLSGVAEVARALMGLYRVWAMHRKLPRQSYGKKTVSAQDNDGYSRPDGGSWTKHRRRQIPDHARRRINLGASAIR